MATGTAGSTARHNTQQQVGYIRRDFTFATSGVKTIGIVPEGAIIVSAGVIVTTAFNAAGNDFLNFGTAADPDGFATDLTLATIGNIVWDELATSNDLGPFTVPTTIVMEYTFTSTAPTTGAGSVYVLYVEGYDAS